MADMSAVRQAIGLGRSHFGLAFRSKYTLPIEDTEVVLLPDLERDEEENEPNEVVKLRENGPRCRGLSLEGCDKGDISSRDGTKGGC